MSRIGTASWNIPLTVRDCFPQEKSLLQRYSLIFNSVEINSSFYRSHQQKTYERWAKSTPENFLFSVKIPKNITHKQRLIDTQELLSQFLDEIEGLGHKLGPLLIQLPPSLKFDQKIVHAFFNFLRKEFKGDIVIEPRHISWAQQEVSKVLMDYNLVQVRADPTIIPVLENWKQPFEYYRLHGSPKIYESSYESCYLAQLAKQLSNSSWVIFDNTKFGAAIENAITLKELKQKENS